MTRSVRVALVTVAIMATVLGTASPALAQGGERAPTLSSAHRPPAGSEKSRVTSPEGRDGVALDLGYVGEPESPIPSVPASRSDPDSAAIAVATALLVSGVVLLGGGTTFMVVTLVRASRRGRQVRRMAFGRNSDRKP